MVVDIIDVFRFLIKVRVSTFQGKLCCPETIPYCMRVGNVVTKFAII